MSDTFKEGDLVWAKMKGFPPWPGRVNSPPKDTKRTPKKNVSHWIFFFGSKNFGWIESNNLKHYEEFKDSLSKANKTAAFVAACNAIEAFIARGDRSSDPSVEATSDTAFDDLVKATTPKPRKSKKSDTPKSESKAESSDEAETSEDKPVDEKPAVEKPSKSKTSEKKAKTKKRSVSPPVNGETPVKKKRQSAVPTPKTTAQPSSESTDDPIMTVYKGSPVAEEKSKPKTVASIIPNVTPKYMGNDIPPASFKIGFLGLDSMGSGIVNNLMESGHKVMVWSKSQEDTEPFEGRGAQVGKTPADVVFASDITFCCVSSPTATKELIFGPDGVLLAMDSSKGYVELTTIDHETSLDIADAIRSKGGKFLEAQLQGSKVEAEQGTLVILCAGDTSLYEDVQTCFRAMGSCSFFLGDAGNAAKMNLVIQLITGVTLGALAEGMALADSAGLRQVDVLEIMSYTSMTSPLVMAKAKQIIDSYFDSNMPLKHMQKDLTLSLALGDGLEHPLPLTAAANEIYKHAMKLGYSMHDASAVYIRAKF